MDEQHAALTRTAWKVRFLGTEIGACFLACLRRGPHGAHWHRELVGTGNVHEQRRLGACRGVGGQR